MSFGPNYNGEDETDMEDQLTNAKISVCYYDPDDELRIRGLKGEEAQEEEQDKPSYHNQAREHGSRGNTKNHSTNKATYQRAQNQPWGMLFSWPQTSTFPFSSCASMPTMGSPNPHKLFRPCCTRLYTWAATSHRSREGPPGIQAC